MAAGVEKDRNALLPKLVSETLSCFGSRRPYWKYRHFDLSVCTCAYVCVSVHAHD